MPCFRGIAVSIHANGAPLPEHGIQKQSRVSRINSYIPVPQPQLSPDSNKPEAAKFAISITLLTPSLPIPYSTPKPTEANPYPRPQLVGELPPAQEEGRVNGIVAPYIPMTNSENETIAAYIYFDGRAKEEVATLLRPGEETWVNSRWVQVPESEGGGLAEREFLFREVGLERWLNGLDLEGHDAAKKLEKRRQRFERRRKRQEDQRNGTADATGTHRITSGTGLHQSTFRYGGADALDPVDLSDCASDDSPSDDEQPEATGQIKVAMFRVLASGEIKKGEYSPQFDAHDDDDDAEGAAKSGGAAVESDVEHTTSFAKPKSLDPKTISTQTVTGIDGPDRPYATFTFFYRGERQLQKMGVIPSAKGQQTASTTSNKRRSTQLDFTGIGSLKTGGTVNFSAFRDQEAETARRKIKHKKNRSSIGAMTMDEDSDDDDDDDDKIITISGADDKDDKDDKDFIKASDRLGPDDAKFTGELADGVNRIQLKRRHSAEPDASPSDFRKSPSTGDQTPDLNAAGTAGAAPGGVSGLGAALAAAAGISAGMSMAAPGAASSATAAASGALGTSVLFGKSLPDDSIIGSPLKRHRASLAEGLEGEQRSGLGSSFPPALGDILAKAEAAQKQQSQTSLAPAVKEEDEEL
ncbi:hypothetical protein CMQ_5528 [Grosmannia clavigera kw1407]|uniref:DUF7918 domain-containing protein n=1 Tax=Grosmannia clavigera (strain kw1407 / UAMH 11150) TaxID=655863 RepID=F0XT48_GROCL|nr:uncharacterized protein CMQ_5528 [Grosmannia clavigera kw1407]EFW99107.1 hypothetical protein CMQ_5528 [Grosmannia clavigera kw1407]